MAGVEDGDEFRDAEDAAGTDPPPSPSPAWTPTKSKPAAAAGGFGRRLLASFGLRTSFSAAISRPSAPSSPKPPAPQPPAAPNLGLGLLLHQGPDPSPDGSIFFDASARNLQLPPTADLQNRHEEGEVLEEQGAAAQLVLQHGDGEDQVIGHDFGVGEELAVLPIEEEGWEKEDVADGCSGNRNGSSVQDLDREGEQFKIDDLGAAQEVVEQEGATTYYTAVEDQSNSDAELCVGDTPTAIKHGTAVEEKKAIEQGCAVGILVVAEAGVVGGLQEEGDGLVEGQGEDAISVQDQHMVVEQCTSDELGVAMGDSWLHDQEEVVVEQEGITVYFDAAVEDQSNNAALEQHTSDELRVIKDGNVVEEEEKAVEQEIDIGILGPAEDGIDMGLREEDVVVEGQGEAGVSAQDQDKVVEHCMSDELRADMGDGAVHDQEVVLEQAGVVESFDDAMEDQSNNTDMEQCTSDELREVKGGNVVEEKVKALEQEGATGMLDAAEGGFPVQEENVVVEGQSEDEISVQDQHKLGVAMGDSTIQDDDLVLDQEEVTEYFDAVVEDQNNYAAVEQCTHGELRGGNFVEVKDKAVHQECVIGVLGVAKDDVAVELQEKKGMVVEGQGEDGAIQYQHKVVEECAGDELEVAICDSTIQDQEMVVEQEGTTCSFDAEAEDHSNKASVKQCTSDELREVKDGNIEEIKKGLEQEGVFGFLSAAGNNFTVGLQEEDNMVVEGHGEDGISLQDQHKVVEQCTSDKLGVAMGDSVVQDHEVAALEQEGITKCFDAAVEDQSVSSAVEQGTSDELEGVKDDNFVEEREKVVVEEGAIDTLSSTKDDVTVGLQEEGEVVVVAEQGKGVVYSQDQYKAVEQCASDQVRTTTFVNAAQDQEVVEQEGDIFVRVATADGIAIDTQEKAIEQSAIDKSKATKDTEDKEVVVDQEGLSDKQHAIEDGSTAVSTEEGDVVIKEQGEDGISVQDQDKVLEQCSSDQWRTSMDDDSVEDKEVRRDKIRLCVGYPQRPGRQNCRAYMSTGRCTYGSSCQLNHPQIRAKPDVPSFPSEQGNREVAEILELNRIGLPIREKTRNCTYYMRNGACRYGKRCCYNHPEHVLDVQLYKPTGWDDTNLPSSPHSKKSSEHANLDDISSSEILPPNILRMLLPPQAVPPGTEEKEMKAKKDPEWSSASDESDGCCSADSSGGPLCKQEHHVDYPERPSRKECPFLLRFGNCKFASACHYYHPEDKYASRYRRKDPSLAEELMVYPDKPGAPECPFYMKTGACKFGSECKFHHPKDLPSSMQGPTTPKRLLDAKDHPEAKTTQQDHMDQKQNYPERPGQPECRYYMQFGKCKFLSACIFHHPKDRAPGMPECPFYMKTGTCQFGSACEFYHPIQRGSSKGGEIDDGTDYGHEYPERRGESECFHYMKYGYCKFQMNCKYHHPTDRVSKK